MMTKTQILDAAMELSDADRIDIVKGLLASTREPLSDEWKAEIARRLDEIDRGGAVLVPGDEVFAEVRSFLASKRQRQ
jgi:putative addiction module component (TIGR02574 family)